MKVQYVCAKCGMKKDVSSLESIFLALTGDEAVAEPDSTDKEQDEEPAEDAEDVEVEETQEEDNN